jgi:two-component system chemotaxis response regulator CheY
MKITRPSDLTVLIVEDKKEMRKIIRTILSHIGVKHMYEAVDGQQAWNFLQTSNKRDPENPKALDNKPKSEVVSLVICDWNMPYLSGIELLSKIRDDFELKQLPFLMITSENDKEHVVNALSKQVTGYIVKPFPAKLLEEKINEIFKFKLP